MSPGQNLSKPILSVEVLFSKTGIIINRLTDSLEFMIMLKIASEYDQEKPQSQTADKPIDIDIEILFCVEYCTTYNISPVELLLRQTKINKHF